MKDATEDSFLLLNTELQIPQWKLESNAVCKNVWFCRTIALHKSWHL